MSLNLYVLLGLLALTRLRHVSLRSLPVHHQTITRIRRKTITSN